MSPRIVTISDHIDCPTGFGVQHRHLAVALARAGYDVHSLGLWDTRPVTVTAEGLTRYPAGRGPRHHRRMWRAQGDQLRPDLVITLGDFETFAHLNGAHREFAWCHWLPLDAEPYPLHRHEQMLRYDHLVMMSQFGLRVVQPHVAGRVPLHIVPHGVDTTVFRPHDDPIGLRRKWGKRLGMTLNPDDFVLMARDTNQWRKQTPLLLDALARMPSDVKLVLHCRPLAHPRARGWDLPHLVRHVYSVANRVVFTGEGTRRPALAAAELAELDNLSDLRVSATQGEGFGVITIESMACGTPTVITDCTTSRELVLGEGADQYGPAGDLARVAAWTIEQRRHLRRAVVDPADLAARVVAFRDDADRLARCAEAGIHRVMGAYTVEHMSRGWADLVERVLGERAAHPRRPRRRSRHRSRA